MNDFNSKLTTSLTCLVFSTLLIPNFLSAKTKEACDCKCDNNISKHSEHPKGVDAQKALSWLQHGNDRYQTGKLRKDGTKQSDREKLLPAQNPHTIILSCSDSRVPPEVIFDQKLGEIFVIRTAGESLDNMAIASIEYALEHLGTQLLVVLGHESCGAVKAAFSTAKNQDAGSPALNALVKDIQPRIKKFMNSTPSNAFTSEAKANALGVASDLMARSKIISHKFASKDLDIKTAIYHLNSGWVEFFSNEDSTAPNRLAHKIIQSEKTKNRAPASATEAHHGH